MSKITCNIHDHIGKYFWESNHKGKWMQIFSVFLFLIILFFFNHIEKLQDMFYFFYNLISNQNIYGTSSLYDRHEIVLLIIISSLSKRHIGLPRHINAIPLSPSRNYEHKYKRYPFKDWTFIHISWYFF